MGCTTHQSEILVRPQHGAAMIRNFPAINAIASVCSFSSSYWYWKKNAYFLILFFSSFHFIILYTLNSTFLTFSLCPFHLSHICLFFSLCCYSSGFFFISLSLFMSLLTSIFYISSFFYFSLVLPISSFLNPFYHLNPGRLVSFLSLSLHGSTVTVRFFLKSLHFLSPCTIFDSQ